MRIIASHSRDWASLRCRCLQLARFGFFKFTFPVLLISGREDRVDPVDENAAVLVKALPQGRLEILDGAGHLPEVELPELVNKMLRDFFG
jgi:pimeloyl-ACP methyl ester carboxylesterase